MKPSSFSPYKRSKINTPERLIDDSSSTVTLIKISLNPKLNLKTISDPKTTSQNLYSSRIEIEKELNKPDSSLISENSLIILEFGVNKETRKSSQILE